MTPWLGEGREGQHLTTYCGQPWKDLMRLMLVKAGLWPTTTTTYTDARSQCTLHVVTAVSDSYTC